MPKRLYWTKWIVLLSCLVVALRLFYWQVLSSTNLALAARDQRLNIKQIAAQRGSILTSDGFALATNQPEFLLFAYLPQLLGAPHDISSKLAPLVIDPKPKDATEAAKPLDQRIQEAKQDLLSKLSQTDSTWVALNRHLNKDQMGQISALDIEGLGFDEESIRLYPEASMSAHLLGFVGRNDGGDPQGYFGLEGYYDLELRGKPGTLKEETDSSGLPILVGLFTNRPSRDGRDLRLYLDRSLQHIVETRLKQALETYGAKSGEVAIMDPSTGGILAMAAFPSYHPADFNRYDTGLYKNPLIADTYEPGSTFKVLVMASALDADAVQPDTKCDQTCDGPVEIGKYTISTWNKEYFPGQTMTEVLARSDNTGMIFVANKLTKDKFISYLENFGIGHTTGIDLQEETALPLREKWGDIDLATASFGQGIAITGIQMLQAISAIANDGLLLQPQMVSQVHAGGRTIKIKPKKVRQVISKEAANQVTDMMVEAAYHGEAQWAVLRDYKVAGKTGTAQIPIAGHYDQEKTIASFVGFAPADDPKFAMLVKLTEPTTSPWAAETAAPLWYQIARDALIHLNVPPGK